MLLCFNPSSDPIIEVKEIPNVLTPKDQKPDEIQKTQSATKFLDNHRIPVLKPLSRSSICAPNLQTNKPSRISTTTKVKRQSLLPVTKKLTPTMDVETEIPLLMNKILKISNTSMLEDDSDNKPDKIEKGNVKKLPTTQPAEKLRRSVMPIGPTKGRSSQMPLSLGEKRPFSFTQRMSVVVKTTLNSPARKIARKSGMGTSTHLAQQQQRRSMMAATKFSQTTASRANKDETNIRRSMITNSKTVSANKVKGKISSLSTVKETVIVNQRKSMYPISAKITEGNKMKQSSRTEASANAENAQLKAQETTFTCNSCKEKFRIKSLLDAHRRSHEGDVFTPVVKNATKNVQATAKPSQSSSLHDTSNKCKYCDKKFALVRALHIHLLQNCSKIPPGEKKKLQYTEMNHVEKARLPHFAHHGNGTASSGSSTQATPRMVNTNQKSMDKQKTLVESSFEKGR